MKPKPNTAVTALLAVAHRYDVDVADSIAAANVKFPSAEVDDLAGAIVESVAQRRVRHRKGEKGLSRRGAVEFLGRLGIQLVAMGWEPKT